MDKVQEIISYCKTVCKNHPRISIPAAIVAFILLAFLGVSWRFSIAPITPPDAAFFSAESVSKGEIVATAGFCSECHTRQDGIKGTPFAGDFKMETPFGDFYSSNITPDPTYGIGKWSKPAFVRAMRSGISRNGKQLYPVFPFDHYTHLTDEDLSDLYAYLMTRPAVAQKPRSNSVYFPFNIRLLQAGWKLLLLHKGPITDVPTQSPAWNRGHYLAESASHCGSCHTPRNILGAENPKQAYNGASVDGWIAPPLNSNNPSPFHWSKEDIFEYLSTGKAPKHDVAAGPMGPVVHHFYEKLPESDRNAVAEYFADKMHKDDEQAQADKIQSSINTPAQDAPTPSDHLLFENTCASCHGNKGEVAEGRPELGYSTALWLDTPTNLIQIMLQGISSSDGTTGLVMPSFYNAMSDEELAEVAAYLRRTKTTKPAWPHLVETVKAIRAATPSPINSLH